MDTITVRAQYVEPAGTLKIMSEPGTPLQDVVLAGEKGMTVRMKEQYGVDVQIDPDCTEIYVNGKIISASMFKPLGQHRSHIRT